MEKTQDMCIEQNAIKIKSVARNACINEIQRKKIIG